MAAPNSAYINDGTAKLALHKWGVSKIEHYPAKFSYSSAQKAAFYLDGWLTVEKNGVKGFLGFIYSDTPNSDNYRLHNSSRYGATRLTVNGRPVIVFWDAGLNTRGYTTELTVINQVVGSTMLQAFFKAAVYLNTTSISIETNTYPTMTEWVSIPIGSGPTATNQGYYSPTRGNLDIGLPRGGKYYYLRSVITNPEGTFTYTMPSIMLVLFRRVISKFDADSSYYAYHTGLPLPIYVETVVMNVGDKISFYSDGTLSSDIEPGWYYFEDYCYRTDSNQIVQEKVLASGIVPPGPPAPPSVIYNGYSAISSAEAIDQWYNDPLFSQLFIDKFTGGSDRYYAGWSPSGGFTGVPAEGWYAVSAEGDTAYYRAIYLLEGTIIATA